MKPVIRLFDIDGTIYDTFEKNKAAYEAAGLPFEYTRWHFANNKKLWPETVEPKVFTIKNKIQHEFMHLVTKAPFHDEFFSTSDHKGTLTGSQIHAVWALEEHFKVSLKCLGYDKTKFDKLDVIRIFQKHYDVIYYEDDANIANFMCKHGVNVKICGDIL